MSGIKKIFFSVLLFGLLLSTLPARADENGYNLEQAVKRALVMNFSITSSEANLNAAENWRKAVRGTFGPELSTAYSYSDKQHLDNDNNYSWYFALRQELFSGFATLAAYQKAALQKDNAEAQLAQARLNLICDVQTNFFLYLKAEQNVRSAEDSLKRLEEQLKVTRSFYNVGLRPNLEVLQAEVNVSEAEDTLLRARNALEIQRVRLNTLLILPIDVSPKYVGSLEYIPFLGNMEKCLEQAYRMRPDVIIARKSVEISQKDATTAKSGYYPKVQAEGRWSTQGDNWKANGSENTPTRYSSWSLNLSGSYTIFEGGNTYYRVRQSRQLVNKVIAEEANLKQEVIYQVQSRLLDLDNASKRIRVARTGVEQASEAYRAATARYMSQVGTSLDVMDAQAKLTAAEVALTGAQADYMSALASLYAAIGQENPALSAQ